jgi:LmbE family N-acetylglucosaminyl deacetylase
MFTEGAASVDLKLASFSDGHFPFEARDIKKVFSTDLRDFSPNVVFTHYREDRHQDHRTLSELTWQTFRDHLVLEYEIPKYDGDLGRPNVYVSLNDEIVDYKVASILKSFESQRSKHWFSDDTFRAIMRIRGMECASNGRWAEAFHGRKIRVL